MTLVDKKVLAFLASVEKLGVSDWEVIVARCKSSKELLRQANELVAEHLAQSIVDSPKKETPAAREKRRAEVWVLNDRFADVANAIASMVPKAKAEAFRKAVSAQLMDTKVAIQMEARLKKNAAGRAAIASILAPFDGFITLDEA